MANINGIPEAMSLQRLLVVHSDMEVESANS